MNFRIKKMMIGKVMTITNMIMIMAMIMVTLVSIGSGPSSHFVQATNVIGIRSDSNETYGKFLFVTSVKKCYLDFNETGSPTILRFPNIILNTAFEESPGRQAAYINQTIYTDDFERSNPITSNSSNSALTGWAGNSFLYTVAVVANVSNDVQKQELTYNLEQLESQKATNIFPSRVTRRAKKGKASTLKIKNCSWFTDYHLLSYKDCLVDNNMIKQK